MSISVAHSPVVVNLNVLIDASGNLEVFNAAKPVVTNVIVAEHALPATALYDPILKKGLLELWEPSDAQGDIKVQLANTDQSAEGGLDMTGAYQTFSKALASGLEAILCDKFDCSGASPFLNYTDNVEYYKQRDFGRVALSTYAHYMFGHVDATAAITNDKAFVEAMLSINAAGDDETAGGAAARAAAFTKSTTANVQAWDTTSSGTDANLALRLIKALVAKGLNVAGAPITSLVSANDSASLANIVAQVVGQDASRLMNADSSQRTRDQHIALRFYVGDVIYMNIKLKAPSVNVGTKNQLVSGGTLESMYTEENFTIKITLAAPTEAAVTSYLTSAITNLTTSPTTAQIADLKTYLGGFTVSSPAPVATITVADVPITSLVTNAASSFNPSSNYEVNFVLLTDNTATVSTTALTENSVLYIPATSGTPITLIADGISYTIVSGGSSITVNGTAYALGQKVTIGSKTFVVAFTGSVGLMVQNATPGIAKLATRIGGQDNFSKTSVATDGNGNVYLRYSVSNYNPHTIYNYSAPPVNGGEIPTSVYGTVNIALSYIVKYNSLGQVQWVVGAPGYGPSNMACDSAGNVYIAGSANVPTLYKYTSAPVNGGAVGITQYGKLELNGNHGYIIKYTPNGGVAWATRILRLPGADEFRNINVAVDNNDNVYFTMNSRTYTAGGGVSFYNYTSPPVNSSSNIGTTLYGNYTVSAVETTMNLFIVKYNSSGQIQHINRLDDIHVNAPEEHGLKCDASGNLHLISPVSSTTNMVKMNAPVSLTTLGGAITFTQTKTLALNGSYTTVLVKYDPAGVVQWATYQSGAGYREPFVSVDGAGNVYTTVTALAGTSTSNATFRHYTSTVGATIMTTVYGTLAVLDPTTIQLVKYNHSGVVQWVTKIERENVQYGFNSVVDLLGNLYIVIGHGAIGQSGAPKLYNYATAPVNGGTIGTALYGKINWTGEAPYGVYNSDLYLVKYNANGSVVWGTRVGGTLAELAGYIALDTNDNVLMTGTYVSNPLEITSFVAKPPTPDGNVVLETYGTLGDVNTSAGNNVFLIKYGV